MIDGPIPEGLTFDDVLLLPGKSSILPTQVDTRTCFTRKLELNIPLASAAMDTVTESNLAMAIARQGGIGIVHRNMPIDRQAEEVDRVKRSESGMIVDPVTISPDITLRQALEIMEKYRISGLPVTARLSPHRHSHQPRPALRKKSQSARQLGDDERQSRHRPRRHHARRSRSASCKNIASKNFWSSIRTSTSKASSPLKTSRKNSNIRAPQKTTKAACASAPPSAPLATS